jgi:hypothetical protein
VYCVDLATLTAHGEWAAADRGIKRWLNVVTGYWHRPLTTTIHTQKINKHAHRPRFRCVKSGPPLLNWLCGGTHPCPTWKEWSPSSAPNCPPRGCLGLREGLNGGWWLHWKKLRGPHSLEGGSHELKGSASRWWQQDSDCSKLERRLARRLLARRLLSRADCFRTARTNWKTTAARSDWQWEDSASYTLVHSDSCCRLTSDGGSYWLMDSGGSLTLLLAGLLSLIVVLVLSAEQRLLVVVLEAASGTATRRTVSPRLLLADLPLLLTLTCRCSSLTWEVSMGALWDSKAPSAACSKSRATPVNTPSNCRQLDS